MKHYGKVLRPTLLSSSLGSPLLLHRFLLLVASILGFLCITARLHRAEITPDDETPGYVTKNNALGLFDTREMLGTGFRAFQIGRRILANFCDDAVRENRGGVP